MVASLARRPAGQVTAPATPVEARLTVVWEEILGVRPLGVDDDLLDLGAQSFDLAWALVQIEERFGVPQDPSNQYFGGYGGPVRDLITFLTTRWDGKLRAVDHA